MVLPSKAKTLSSTLPKPPSSGWATDGAVELDPFAAAGEPLLEAAVADLPAAEEEVEVAGAGGRLGVGGGRWLDRRRGAGKSGKRCNGGAAIDLDAHGEAPVKSEPRL